MGALSPIKGFELVSAVIRYAEQAELPLDFVIVGPTIKPLHKETRAAVTGPYRRELLPDILVRERPDCFFFASQVPETFNYALSGCMATGLPIVAISCGAIEERLKDISSATLLPVDSGVEAVVEAPEASSRRCDDDTRNAEYLNTSGVVGLRGAVFGALGRA